MKTLKITFLLFAVLLLTVSGQSSDNVVETENDKVETYGKTDLLAHAKKGLKKPSNS